LKKNALFELLLRDIAHIAKSVYKDYNKMPAGLFSGKAGILLLYLELGNKIDEEYFKQAEIIYQDLIKTISEEQLNYSLSNGFIGILYVFEIIYRKYPEMNVLKKNELRAYDYYIANLVDLLIQNKQLDPIHGLIGVGKYFILRNDTFSKIQIKKIVHYIHWNKVDGQLINVLAENEIINLGLAHGLIGVLSFLIDCYRMNICKKISLEILNDQFYQLLKLIEVDDRNSNFFPINAEGNRFEYIYRYGWCYGEFNIVQHFYKRAKYLKCEISKTKLESKINFIIQRIENHGLTTNDPMFCHGSIGLIYMLNNIRIFMPDLISQEFIYGLLGKHLNEYRNSQFKYLYKYLNYCDNNGYYLEDNASIIEGASGIALCYIKIIDEANCSLFIDDLLSV
jgi:hypothetical protein